MDNKDIDYALYDEENPDIYEPDVVETEDDEYEDEPKYKFNVNTFKNDLVFDEVHRPSHKFTYVNGEKIHCKVLKQLGSKSSTFFICLDLNTKAMRKIDVRMIESI